MKPSTVQKLKEELDSRPCFCVGPQNGEPLCPCQMRGVQQVNGRWVRTQDLGPVTEPTSDDIRKLMAGVQ